jgi:hypothetical protein
LEFENGTGAEKLVFTAGVSSEGANERESEIRRYAMSLLLGFFSQKSGEISSADYHLMLRRIFGHIHKHIIDEEREENMSLDLALVVADTSRAYAARCGRGDLYLFHEAEARSVFSRRGHDSCLLGTDSWEGVELNEASLQPGDILVLCNPAVARVIKERDITLILRRASEPKKASLFLSAIAERKGASGALAALIWEVPNYQGAAILTEETPPAAREEGKELEEGGEEEEVDQADLAKKHWLSLWKRRKD